MKIMFNDIIDNWKSIDNEEEKRILQYYSNRGRILTLGYVGKFVYGYSIYLFYMRIA